MAIVAEFWWIAPAAAGVGTTGALAVRTRRTMTGRRLGYDAARLDLRRAQDDLVTKRAAVKVARTEHTRLLAERARGAAVDPVAARRALRQAEGESKAASATVKARQAQLDAARAEMSVSRTPDQLPLMRLRAQHDAILARWMEYETDSAKLIAYPAISDARDPMTAVFLRAVERANWLRKDPQAKPRPRPEEFSAYRDAVLDLGRAFEAAERNALILAGALPEPEKPVNWQGAAQNVFTKSAEAVDRATEAAAAAIAAWNARNRGQGDNGSRTGQ